jgi:hypothetical protein
VTHGSRRPTALIGLVLAMVAVAAACGTAAPSTSPAASPTASLLTTPAASVASAPPASATTAPSAPPTAAPPSSAAACPVEPVTGQLPSDRLTDVVISTTDTADVVTFVFGNSSIGSPAGTPLGSFDAVEPPFTEVASGQPITIGGEHVVRLKFEHMSLQNDAGEPVYDGELAFRPDLAALKDVVNDDLSEGVIGWLLAWDGSGCATLANDGHNVTVTIDHPAS